MTAASRRLFAVWAILAQLFHKHTHLLAIECPLCLSFLTIVAQPWERPTLVVNVGCQSTLYGMSLRALALGRLSECFYVTS